MTATLAPSSNGRISFLVTEVFFTFIAMYLSAEIHDQCVAFQIRCLMMLHFLVNQVEQGEQEDPDDVHDVPVQSAEIDGGVVRVAEVA